MRKEEGGEGNNHEFSEMPWRREKKGTERRGKLEEKGRLRIRQAPGIARKGGEWDKIKTRKELRPCGKGHNVGKKRWR